MEAHKNSNPEELLVSQEYAELLESKLEESLSDLENRVLYLHLMGTDYRTIARLLDKSPKTVDNALQWIKAKTQKILEREKLWKTGMPKNRNTRLGIDNKCRILYIINVA